MNFMAGPGDLAAGVLQPGGTLPYKVLDCQRCLAGHGPGPDARAVKFIETGKLSVLATHALV